jgi:hypothetical protein
MEVLKKTKKAQIKEWMTEFEQREGRPPTNQDKEVRTGNALGTALTFGVQTFVPSSCLS